MLSQTHLNTALVQSELHLKPSALRTEQGWSHNAACSHCASPQAGLNLEGLQGSTPQDLGQERPNRPRPVPEHLSDIAESQVDDLECIVSGTAKQMQLVMAEAQGGNPALYRDDLDTVGAPEEVGIKRDEEDAS